MAVKQLGIKLHPSGRPVTPTIVYVRYHGDFEMFARACGVKRSILGSYANLLCASESDYKLGILRPHGHGRYPHIAFLGIDPRGYWMDSPIWSQIEEFRSNREFTRAFYYPDWQYDSIQPNIIREEGREWLPACLRHSGDAFSSSSCGARHCSSPC